MSQTCASSRHAAAALWICTNTPDVVAAAVAGDASKVRQRQPGLGDHCGVLWAGKGHLDHRDLRVPNGAAGVVQAAAVGPKRRRAEERCRVGGDVQQHAAARPIGDQRVGVRACGCQKISHGC